MNNQNTKASSHFRIVSYEERIRDESGIKVLVLGRHGIGKTRLVETLDEPTLFLEIECGMKSLLDWKGDKVALRTWDHIRDWACLIGGPNPNITADKPYSTRHYEAVCKNLNPDLLKGYRCYFIDSLTVASRLCLAWAENQPTSKNKYGAIDMRSAYGTMARELIAWLNQIQSVMNKDVVLVGALDQLLDDDKKPIWAIQCEGEKTSREVPGILDEVLVMENLKRDDGKTKRSFVCNAINPYGYPMPKDRSGKLEVVEDAHLGKLFEKIRGKALARVADSSSVQESPAIAKHRPDILLSGSDDIPSQTVYVDELFQHVMKLRASIDSPESYAKLERWWSGNYAQVKGLFTKDEKDELTKLRAEKSSLYGEDSLVQADKAA